MGLTHRQAFEEILAVGVEGKVIGHGFVHHGGVDLDSDGGPSRYDVCGFMIGETIVVATGWDRGSETGAQHAGHEEGEKVGRLHFVS